jgi:hypothetical protein
MIQKTLFNAPNKGLVHYTQINLSHKSETITRSLTQIDYKTFIQIPKISKINVEVDRHR